MLRNFNWTVPIPISLVTPILGEGGIEIICKTKPNQKQQGRNKKKKERNGMFNQSSGKVQKRKLKDERIPGWM